VAHAQLRIVGQQGIDADQDGIVRRAQSVGQGQRFVAADGKALPRLEGDAAVDALRPRQRDE
jgi:hypothetical protein